LASGKIRDFGKGPMNETLLYVQINYTASVNTTRSSYP
jgi:hypothetical protein